MGLKDWLRSDAERLGRPIPRLMPEDTSTPGSTVSHDPACAQAVVERLPRGADVIRDQIDRKERARWARANEIAAFRYRQGHAVLGKNNGHLIGIGDDKPMVTIASARSGKTSTVLKPTLYTYPGSMVVLDPKGELAQATARHRRDVLGQDVYVIDAFSCSGEPAASFNPLAELDPASPSILDDVDIVCDTIILDESGADGSHWTNSARGLLRGLILHALQLPPSERNLVTVRQLLMLTYPPLVELQAELAAKGAKDPADAAQNALFIDMSKQSTAFGGALAGTGNSFLRKAPRERASVVSTAETQTNFLDSLPLQDALRTSDFRLRDIAERPTTLYICLPASHMTTHFRWLRLVVRLALMALEKRGTWERGKPPIIFLMEEFATLGHLAIMEQAAAYFPGFGVKLWCVLQDIGQLQRHYAKSYGTFLGNAGVLQFFSNSDKVSLDYISDRLGSLSFVRGKFGEADDDNARNYVDKERLMYGHEIAESFSRGTGAQLLLIEGQPPMALERLTFEDVEMLRKSIIMMPAP